MMDKQLSSASDLSLDSLENESKKKTHRKNTHSEEENIDTILVPFYENDVLIKVPKDLKKKQKQETNSKLKKEFQSTNSYLVNKKDLKKSKRTTYLEIFRKQFTPAKAEKKQEEKEIRSISPEYGDTERESIGEDDNNPAGEFYNTEAYNEIYYDKILNLETENYLDNSFDEGLQFEKKALRSESPNGSAENNLKSVSEVSQPRRHMRRATVQPIDNVKLGGLGPDIEKIKPRLERARSLQRYSEKVRMENRLRIYKKSIQADMEMKAERETSARRRESAKEICREDQSASYLVNKALEEKTNKKLHLKSKSASAQRTRERNKDKELLKDERTKKNYEESQNSKQDTKDSEKTHAKVFRKDRKVPDDCDTKIQSVRSSARNRGVNTDKESVSKEIPPVQISFLVNVGGLRPSSALKTLEEKHRMYQEQVKAFTMNSNNI